MTGRVKVALLLGALALAPAVAGCLATGADERPVLLIASTTSARDSGFLDYVQETYERDHAVRLRITAVGTGQAIRLAQNGDADLLLTHARELEEAFVKSGHGLWRRPVMYNYFYVAGPGHNPARLNDVNASEAFGVIAEAGAPFVSRGDRSGTHIRELALWSWTSHRPHETYPAWYVESGAGMGQTLLIAEERRAYVLTDDATYHAFHDAGKIPGLTLYVTQDPELRNQYALTPVSDAMHPNRNTRAAVAFTEWLTGPQGQQAIMDFRVQGRQLFTPNAHDPEA